MSPDTTTIALGFTFLLLLFIAACIPRRKRERGSWGMEGGREAYWQEIANYSEYLASPVWLQLAAAARKRDGHRCRCCNRGKWLNVHHRCYPNVLGTERLEDLTTLCEDCHGLIHNSGLASKPRYRYPTRAVWQRKG